MKSIAKTKIIHTKVFYVNPHFNGIGSAQYNFNEVSKDSVLKAEKLSKYFIAMAKIKIDSIENSNKESFKK